MSQVYKENIALQKKLDSIKHRGNGISKLANGVSFATLNGFSQTSKQSRTPAVVGGRGSPRARQGASP